MAARYWVSGGTGNTNSTTNWSTTSGGASGASVPTSADDAIWNNLSGSGTVTVNAAFACLTANFTGFTGTFAGSSTVSVSGNLTLGAGTTYTYTGTLSIAATATLTSNAKTFTGTLVLCSQNATVTLADNWTVQNFTHGANNRYIVINGFSISVLGAYLTAQTATNPLTGTTVIKFIGTNTWTASGYYDIRMAFEINTASSVLISGNVGYSIGSLTIISGTIISTGSTLIIPSGSAALTTNGQVFNNLTVSTVSGASLTCFDNVTLTGNLQLGVTNQATSLNGFTVYAATMTLNSTTGNISGTTNIELTGNGNLTSSLTSGFISNNLTFNNGANTLTIVGNINYRTGTLTRTSGTINTGTSTLSIGASTTLNTAGVNWYNVTLSGASTITNNSLLTVSNNLIYALGSVITFSGTIGWTAATFDIQTSSNVNHILKSGVTYTVTTNFISIATTNANKDTLKSSTPGVQAIFTLNQGATQSVGYTNATDIDSSLGQAIYVANGTLSNATNWNPLTATDMGGGGSLIFVN